jgi:hypothetical protein
MPDIAPDLDDTGLGPLDCTRLGAPIDETPASG